MYERDRHTDGQTDTAWRQRLHLMLASHGKNENDDLKISKQQLNSNRQQTWQPFKNNSEVFASPYTVEIADNVWMI